MAFHLGSLGFLTPFKFDTYQSQVTQIIEGTECSPACMSVFLQRTRSGSVCKACGVLQVFSTEETCMYIYCMYR